MMSASPTPPVIGLDLPTAADLRFSSQARKTTDLGGWYENTSVSCRGVQIGIIQMSKRTGGDAVVVKTLRTAGVSTVTLKGADPAWLLDQHIEHDLGGAERRVAMIRPGISFRASEDIALSRDNASRAGRWFFYAGEEFGVTDANESTVTYITSTASVQDTSEESLRVHGREDSLPLAAFEYLVRNRFLLPSS